MPETTISSVGFWSGVVGVLGAMGLSWKTLERLTRVEAKAEQVLEAKFSNS